LVDLFELYDDARTCKLKFIIIYVFTKLIELFSSRVFVLIDLACL